MVLRRQYRQLREELTKLAPPEGGDLTEIDYPFNTGITPTTPSTAAADPNSAVTLVTVGSKFPAKSLPADKDLDDDEIDEDPVQDFGEDEDNEVIVKPDEEIAAAAAAAAAELAAAQDENADLSPEEIVLSMVW